MILSKIYAINLIILLPLAWVKAITNAYVPCVRAFMTVEGRAINFFIPHASVAEKALSGGVI